MLQTFRTDSIPLAARIAIGFSFALGCAFPSFAQESIAPRGPRVEVDRSCALSPIPFEVDGETVVTWFQLDGVWARRGPRLDELDAGVKIVDGNPTGIQVAARPGGFVLAWVGDDWPLADLTFQHFSADLMPEAPPVVVGSAPSLSTPALTVDAAGNVTIAWSEGEEGVKARRYSNAGLPITPEIVVQPASHAPGVWLAASDAGFLVAWSDFLDLPGGTARYSARAYSQAASPLGPVTDLFEDMYPNFLRSTFQVASVDGGYLVVRLGGLARLLDADGTSLGPETPLGVAADAQGIQMDGGPEGVWLGWHNLNNAVFASLIDPSTLTAAPPTLLALHDRTNHITAIRARESGFMAGWNIHLSSVILPAPPCDWGEIAYSQEFGPFRGAVDVPTLSKTGLALFALAFAIAGVLMLRAL
jgi:hypothetical protein